MRQRDQAPMRPERTVPRMLCSKKEAERLEEEARAELQRALGAATLHATPAPDVAAAAPAADASAAPAAPAQTAAAAEAEKQRKKLTKKLREIEDLEAKAAAGVALNPDQLSKVAAALEVREALAALVA